MARVLRPADLRNATITEGNALAWVEILDGNGAVEVLPRHQVEQCLTTPNFLLGSLPDLQEMANKLFGMDRNDTQIAQHG